MKKKRGTGRNLREPPSLDGDSPSMPPSPHDTAPPPAAAETAPTPAIQFGPPLAGRFHTQCPRCKTIYRIGVAQLRSGRGLAHCQECQADFNVLETLAETAARARADAAPVGPVLLGRLDTVAAHKPEHGSLSTGDGLSAFSASDAPPDGATGWDAMAEASANRPGQAAWGIGALLLLALLAVQLGAFEGLWLAQDEGLRPWLDSACQTLGCRLPVFRAPLRIQIIGHDLRPAPDGLDGYEFTLVLANEASQPQAFPAVKLILSAYNGSPAAARVFEPAEYLSPSSPVLMPVGELQEIRLLLAKPRQEIGGFSFELL